MTDSHVQDKGLWLVISNRTNNAEYKKANWTLIQIVGMVIWGSFSFTDSNFTRDTSAINYESQVNNCLPYVQLQSNIPGIRELNWWLCVSLQYNSVSPVEILQSPTKPLISGDLWFLWAQFAHIQWNLWSLPNTPSSLCQQPLEPFYTILAETWVIRSCSWKLFDNIRDHSVYGLSQW